MKSLKITGRTDPNKKMLIRKLKAYSKENEIKIWSRLAKKLSKPKRIRAEVNVSTLNRYSKPGETIVVPGKVLGSGELKHNLNIYAEAFSKSSKEMIEKLGGTCQSIEALLESNPTGKNVRIFE